MNILYSKDKTVFIPVTYTGMDPGSRLNQLFTFPIGTDFSSFHKMYIYYNGSITAITKYTVLSREKRLKLNLPNFPDIAGASYKLLCDTTSSSGLDFIDKFNLGTVYTYTSFSIANPSRYNRLINTSITSENLLLGFLTDYPLQFKSRQYTNGVPDITLGNLDFFNGLDSSKLIAFFNGVYAGVINSYGQINSYTTSKKGLVEIIYRGGLEFSLSSSGPWSNILTLPSIACNSSIQIYVRCGQNVTALARYLFSIKIFSMEAV